MKIMKTLLCSLLIVVFVLLLSPVFRVEAAEDIPEDAVEWNGHFYQIFDAGISWEDARIACSQMGGHLVTITSAEEQAFVLSLLKDAKLNVYWLGCRLNYDWAWVTGESFSYSNWGAGEPNDEEGEEAYVQIYAKSIRQKVPGDWNDASNVGAEYSSDFYSLKNTGYICEWDMLDSDGDGLYDHWEINGVDTDGNGVPDLLLNEMGADPDVPDIFVEVDWMVRPSKKLLFWKIQNGRSMLPSASVFQMVYEAFAARGIQIHIDAGPDSVDYTTGKTWGSLSGGNEIAYVHSFSTDNWGAVVAENFASGREIAFKHCIFADTYNNSTSSGIANGIPGQYFIVANQDGLFQGGDIAVAGTFMHELGHTLGLKHGGCDHVHYKPNYLSVMNYLFQTTGIDSSSGGVLDYSGYLLPDIDENDIHEEGGIDPENTLHNSGLGTSWYRNGRLQSIFSAAGSAIDFNGNGQIENGIAMDLNNDGQLSILKGYTSDWDNLIFAGGRIGDMTALGKKVIIDESQLENEKTLEEAIASQTLGSEGEGYAECANVMLRACIENQTLCIKVTNRGAVDTTYQLNIRCDEILKEHTAEIFVEGSSDCLQSVIYSCPVKDNLQTGTFVITLTLLSSEGKEYLFQHEIQVYDPSDEELAELRQVIEGGELDAFVPEDEVRQYILFAISSERFSGYQINFDPNGGIGVMGCVEGFMGGRYTLPECLFTAPDGMEFAGWSYEKNGAAIDTLSCEVEGDTTLYAIWKVKNNQTEGLLAKIANAFGYIGFGIMVVIIVSITCVVVVMRYYRKRSKK